MMRAIWNGAVSFGLVNVPVRLYAATTNHDIRFHQVHERDGGRIRQKRTCSVCGEEVQYSEIAKGYETDDGQLIMLDDDDLATLPVASGHEIDVVQFVPSDQIDALLLDKSYYLEPENKAVKPYALLREALRETDRMAVVKVALRQRETLALLRVRDEAIVLQTMLWSDEVREPEFETLRTEVDLRPQEMQMASSLVESLSGDFDSDQFEDDYRQAMVDLIEYKREHGGGRPAPEPAVADEGDDMTDLLTALRRSVEAAGGKAPAEEPAAASADSGSEEAAAEEKPKRSRSRTKKTEEKTEEKAEEATAEAPKKSTRRSPSKKKSEDGDEETAPAKGRRTKSA
ncbi:Ku protein [Actinomycetospora straminea]|uniref:Non-homologous end joining protein Ku n=1 Tax=Actinomycetospora straminea TaxID=663607 RepID=A0ABP9EDT9_9PSEU|nr:Ku protein [Actinomycetospora straminea]MDD7934551.1 Ku protein [Actinomycetospora straminea]